MYELALTLIWLITILICKQITDDYFNPKFIIIVYWATFEIASFIVLKDIFTWSIEGVLWIYIASIAFFIGSLLGERIYLNNNHAKKINIRKQFLSKNSWRLLVVIILLGIIRTGIETVANGFKLSMFLDFDSLVNMNLEMAEMRYSTQGGYNSLLLQILLIFTYAAPICGGYARVYANTKIRKIISYCALLPIATSMLLTNGKNGVVASIILWSGSFIVGYISKYGHTPKIKIKYIVYTMIFLIALFSILIFSMMLRIGEFDFKILKYSIEKFGVYGFGHVAAFDQWFSINNTKFDYGMGTNTFMAIFKSLGLAVREQGVFTDIIVFKNNILTNVYTTFRGIIMDFGVYGGILFMSVSGVFSGYLFKKLQNNDKKNTITKTLLVMIYFSILFSFVSPWVYLSYILAFFVFGLYLYLS